MKKRIRHIATKAHRGVRKHLPGRLRYEENLEEVEIPRITNDQVSAHREEVLRGARKYIYPLQHSKHKIVLISTGLLIGAAVVFIVLCVVNFYKLQTTSTFYYRVSQVLPFPVGRIDNTFVSYENYLFELRHYIHYYQDKQRIDFESESGKQQLTEARKRALDRIINDAYAKRLAAERKISVSDAEVELEISRLREQNRIGSNTQVLEDVLRDYWGWTMDDFRRSLRSQLLSQKLVAAMDTDAQQRVQKALAEIKSGKDFAEVAKAVSDDPATKSSGGSFGIDVDENNHDLPPQTVDAIFSMKQGEVSAPIDIGTGLEIVKILEVNGDKRKAAHILIRYKDLNTFLNDIKEKQPSRIYIKL